MSHEITVDARGLAEAMYANGNPAWHSLGVTKTTGSWISADEAIAPTDQGGAGLGFIVDQEPMGRFRHPASQYPDYLSDPTAYMAEHGNPWLPCVNGEGEPNILANVRQDTGLYLGNVTDQYQVVQNSEAFTFMDALVDNGEMSYEAAFSLGGGKKVCLLGLLPNVDKVVDGDEQLRYLLLTLCHDGSGAIKFGPTSVRVVCANTYRLAIESKGSKVRELSIRHSGDIMEKLAEARDIISHAGERFEVHADTCRQLAQYRMATDTWIRFLDIVCPQLDKADPRWTDRREKAIAQTREDIRLAYHDEKQDTAPFSGWAAFNAVTQHIDHLPRKGRDDARRAEARFNVCLYGTGHTQKQFAWETICRIADVKQAV